MTDALLSYRVVAQSGFWIDSTHYDVNAIVSMTARAARYLVLAGTIALANGSNAVPIIAPTPVPVTETNTTLVLTVNGVDRKVTIADMLNLFPDMRGATGADGTPGQQGIQGVPGPVPTIGSVVAGEALTAGMPVVVSLLDGKLYAARADVYTRAKVIGLARANTVLGFACDVEGFALTLSDWTAITGAAALVPGTLYFLGASAGALVAARPAIAGQTCMAVGIASSASTLTLRLGVPILL